MDDLLDDKLMTKFGEAQVEAFQKDFASFPTKYEALDKTAVDTLSQFLDFNEFKTHMLRVKAMTSKEGSSDSQPIQAVTADEALLTQLATEDVDNETTGWSKVTDFKKDAGKPYFGALHKKIVPGYSVNWTRSDLTFVDCKIEAWRALLQDIEGMAKENPKLVEFNILEKHPSGLPKLIYERIAMGMMFSERELVIKFEEVTSTDGSMTFTVSSIDHPDYPEDGKRVRMKIFKRSRIRPDGPNMKLEEVLNMNMGGYVPSSILNMMIGSLYGAGLDKMVPKIKEK